MKGVLGKCAVQIVMALILLLVLRVHLISPGMRCLQNNIQSVNTSLSLLRYTMQRLQIDVALLQEVWHPPADTINIHYYASTIMKLRQGSEGGGVAILTHRNVKSIHL